MNGFATGGRFRFHEAGPPDDAVLRRILRETPLPGWIALSYEREPSYFAGCAVEGETQTVLATTAAGEPVGFFSRAVRSAFIEGRPLRLGYLGQLRLLPAWRARTRAILRGFEVCRALLADGRQDTPYYLTSILAGNSPARRLLASGVRGLPTYLPLRGFITLVAATRQRYGEYRLAEYASERGSADAVETLAALLQDYGRDRALYPCWTADALRALEPVGWRGADMLLVRRGGRLVACGAVWDQRSVRQWRVVGYRSPLARLRPLVNAGSWLGGFPRLPAPGRALEQGFLSHLAVRPGEEAALPVLLAGLLRLARAGGLDTVALGLAEDHPWLARLGGLRALRYRSQLYLVHWEQGRAAAERLRGALVQPEAACL